MRFIPTRLHGFRDYGVGLLLAASPWLFGFADQVYLPHLSFGLLESGVALTTEMAPGGVQQTARRTA